MECKNEVPQERGLLFTVQGSLFLNIRSKEASAKKVATEDELPEAKVLRKAIEYVVSLSYVSSDDARQHSTAVQDIIDLLSLLEHKAGGDVGAPGSIAWVLEERLKELKILKEKDPPVKDLLRMKMKDILLALEKPREKIALALSALLLLHEVDENVVDLFEKMAGYIVAGSIVCGSACAGGAGAAVGGECSTMSPQSVVAGAVGKFSTSAAALTDSMHKFSRDKIRPLFLKRKELRKELKDEVKILRELLDILPQPALGSEDGKERLLDDMSLRELKDAVRERFRLLRVRKWDDNAITKLLKRLHESDKFKTSGASKSLYSGSAGAVESEVRFEASSIEKMVTRMTMLEKALKLRELVKETTLVAVVGRQNAGKSTLIKTVAASLSNREVDVKNIGQKMHTTDLGAYETEKGLWLVDFPGCNSESLKDIADQWRTSFPALPSLCVVVHLFNGKIEDDLISLYKEVKEHFHGIDILVVVNQADKADKDEYSERSDFYTLLEDFCKKLSCRNGDVVLTALKSTVYDEDLASKGVLDGQQLATVIVERVNRLPVSTGQES